MRQEPDFKAGSCLAFNKFHKGCYLFGFSVSCIIEKTKEVFMKRISLIALLVLISLCFVGCSAVMKILPIREYRGTPLTSLSYETVDYMGGMSETYVLDFDKNTVTRISYIPYNEDGETEQSSNV